MTLAGTGHPKKLMGHGSVLTMLLSMTEERIQKMLNSPSPAVEKKNLVPPPIGSLE